MTWLRVFIHRLLGLFLRRKLEQELEEEIRAHLDMQMEDNLQRGMSPDEARYAARQKFGGAEQIKESYRDRRSFPVVESTLQDLRYGGRMLLKQPGFTIVAVLTLALGIGANTAILSVINALFLRPLPVKSPHELVGVFQTQDAGWANGFSYPDFLYYRDRNTTFSGLSAYHLVDLADHDAREIVGCIVPGNYFSMLGVQVDLGRSFFPAEDEVPGKDPVAVLSHKYWQLRFSGDPTVVGKTVKLSGVNFTVVGIAPEGFRGAQSEFTPVDVWLPTMMAGQVAHREDTFSRNSYRLYKLIGRLKPGQTSSSAEAELKLLASQLESAYPATNKGRGIRLVPASHIHPGDFNEKARLPRLLAAGVSCLLLIACVNLAGLLLSRGLNRRKEIAIRLSLGASRRRVVRQLLTESLLLSLLGGAAGLPLASWATELLNRFFADLDLRLDPLVLGFAAALAAGVGITFGLAPALQASRTDFNMAIKAAGLAQGYHRTRLRTALVVTQVALSLVLLVNAGLLIQSLKNVLLNQDFESEHVASIRLKTNLVGYDQARTQRYYREVLRRLESLPGVQFVSFGGAPLLVKDGPTVQLPGQPLVLRAPASRVTPHYFETLGIPLTGGRSFDEQDGPNKRRVVIVNESLAKGLWPDREPIGMPVLIDGQEREVVGVTKFGNHLSRSDMPRDFLFLPEENPGNRLLVRVTGDVLTMLPVLRKELTSIDPAVPISEMLPLTEVVKLEFRSVRLAGGVLSFAGALALLLTSIGLYGTLAFAVRQRTREIGIRLALGAQSHQIRKMVLGEGLALTAVGSALGLAGAGASARMLSAFLYGVSVSDSTAFVVAPLLLMTVAFLACWMPARQATKVDPMLALKSE
jgi:predicted permease